MQKKTVAVIGADPSHQVPAGRLLLLLLPALTIILGLFGGGLLLGLFGALGQTTSSDFTEFSLRYFSAVFQDPDFFKSLFLTLYISTVSTLIAALVSIGLALFLIQQETKSRLIHFILQIPLTVPHLVIAIAVMFLLAPTGLGSRFLSSLNLIDSSSDFPLLVNDTWGVGILTVYAWKEIPFITFMLLSVLKNMGLELLEAGATLGGSKIQRFSHITLPIILPSLSAACLIVFAFTFGTFEVPYLLGRSYPLTLPVWAYKNYSDVDLVARPEGIAIGLIIAAIIIVTVMASQAILQFNRRRGFSI